MKSAHLLQERILIVDDQRPFQLLLKGILHSLGYRELDFANSGEQALQRCQQQSYDIIFIDYNLGSGKNGRQLLEDLHQLHLLAPSTVCMLITGENTLPMVLSAVELEPDDYLIKPFSQNVLRSRLLRLQTRKRALLSVYQAIRDKNWVQQADCCESLRQTESRYQSLINRFQVQALLHLEQYQSVRALLAPVLQQRRPIWALLQQAKLHLACGEYQFCLQLCDEILAQNQYVVEALDLKSYSYQHQDDLPSAITVLQQAMELSPFHLERLTHLFQLHCSTQQWPKIIETARQLYELTKRSGQNDPQHLLTYIRTLLAGSAATEDQMQKNRWQQESLLCLQRAKRDEHLIKKLDFNQFELLCMARLESNDGGHLKAHQLLHQKNFSCEIPAVLAADHVLLLNQLGEFDEADAIALDIKQPEAATDSLLKLQQQQMAANKDTFRQFSQQAAAAYQQTNYPLATKNYEHALQCAPLNTNTQLNLCQSIIQWAQSSEYDSCKPYLPKLSTLIKQLQAKTLSTQQQERLDTIVAQSQASAVDSGFH